ncbi:MAG: DUF115 domain-containing protein [Clostridiales bacterium]|nr:DUF115 domain-containing protein [Clostridiales bacterium]
MSLLSQVAYLLYFKPAHMIKVKRFKKTIKELCSDPLTKELLHENEKLKNVHSGKRCFILGNGPSLKTVDFSKLENEYVFTVNQISRMPDFYKLKTNYHFWADPFFFKIDINNPEDAELLSTMKNINASGTKPLCFFPVGQYDFVKLHDLGSFMDIAYFLSYGRLEDYSNYGTPIDYVKTVPEFGTVVQWCITTAIYMGFSEIYLLGCDNTGLMGTINTILKASNTESHAYTTTENEEKRKYKIFTSLSLEGHINAYYNTFVDYRLLREYCDSHNIKLINCSSTTVIDCIPRKDLDDVL